MHTNIYPTVVHDLHTKVRNYIDELNGSGQIDLDKQGYPYVLEVNSVSGSFQVKIVRNRQVESFTLNPRKRIAKPIITWNPEDGYHRPAPKKQVIQIDDPKDSRKIERKKRPAFENFESLVNDILES